jgi:hypothetical protein
MRACQYMALEPMSIIMIWHKEDFQMENSLTSDCKCFIKIFSNFFSNRVPFRLLNSKYMRRLFPRIEDKPFKNLEN